MKHVLWGVCGGVAAFLITWGVTRSTPSSAPATGVDLASQLEALREGLSRTNAALARERKRNRSAVVAAAAAPAVPASDEDAESAAESEPKPSAPVDETPGGTDPEVREKAFFHSYFSELDETLETQGVDAKLTEQAKQLAVQVLQEEQIGELVDVECGKTLCRFEVKRRSTNVGTLFAHRLMKRAKLFEQGSVHIPTDELEMVAFFSMNGSALPAPTIPFDDFTSGEKG